MFGIILPIADKHDGVWYPPKKTWSNSKDVRGTYAYQVFTALAMFLGEPALHCHAVQCHHTGLHCCGYLMSVPFQFCR